MRNRKEFALYVRKLQTKVRFGITVKWKVIILYHGVAAEKPRWIIFRCYAGIVIIRGDYGYKNEENGLQWIIQSARLGYNDAIELLQAIDSNEE